MAAPNGNSGPGQGNQELQTWKEIADYLSVTTRTAQAWEQDRGLPVRRLPGGRGRVLAYTHEIDEWKGLAQCSSGNVVSNGRRRAFVAIAATLAAAALLAAWTVWGRSSPAGFRADGRTVVALDSRGKDLWRFPLPVEYHLAVNRHSQPDVQFADIDGDRRNEVFVNAWADEPSEDRNARLICLSSSGSEMWQYSPGRRVRSSVEDFPLPYKTDAFALFRSGPNAPWKVVVSSHQLVLYANEVALLHANTGEKEREYWHSGALNRMLVHDLDGNGRPEIYLGGIHNASKQAVLVALDPSTMDGASVEGNPNYQLAGFAPGVELARVYFPASCHTRKLDQYNFVGYLKPDPDGLEIQIGDPMPGDTFAGFHYFLRSDLTLRTLLEGDNNRGLHNALHRSGFLDHDLTEAERAAKWGIQVVRPGQPAPVSAPPVRP